MKWIIAGAISNWLGDEGGNAGDFAAVEDKVIRTGGHIINFWQGICVAIALISFAIGIVLFASNSKKTKEEGKDRIIAALVGLFLSGIVFTVLSFIINSF